MKRASRLLLIFALAGCGGPGAPGYAGADGSTFDGERFHNLDPDYEEQSFGKMLAWKWMREAPEWPDEVDIAIAARPPQEVGSGRIRMTFVGHATVLVQIGDTNVLIDPMWSERSSLVSWAGPKRVHAPGIRFEDLPPIHGVLISHNHFDHLDLETLRRLAGAHHPKILAGLGTKALLDREGISGGVDLDWWQAGQVGSVRVEAVPAQHWSGRIGYGDRFNTLWCGFVLTSPEGRKVFYSGDTGFGTHLDTIKQRFGQIDLGILPLGAYEPRALMRYNHISPPEAVRVHQMLGHRYSLGVHFGTFQQSDEGFEKPLQDLGRALAEAGLGQDEVFAINPGATVEFDQELRPRISARWNLGQAWVAQRAARSKRPPPAHRHRNP